MAYVVRRVSLLGMDGTQVSGAAFEFMPESEASATAVQEFVRYVLSLRRDGLEPPAVSSQLDASIEGNDAPPQSATLRELSVRSLVLDTSWSVKPGEPVVVDVRTPGMSRRICLEGRAVKVTARATPESEKPRYSIEVEVQTQSERPLHSKPPPGLSTGGSEPAPASEPVPLPLKQMNDEEVSQTIDDLLSALIVPPAPEPKKRRRKRLSTHLSGLLARVPVTTLFSLFEMERMTGRLAVRTPSDHVTIWLSDGQLFDIEPIPQGQTARQRIATVLSWNDGAFEYYVEPVDRENKIGTSTTALLLDLARQADEAARDA
jgi:hypothetical protein